MTPPPSGMEGLRRLVHGATELISGAVLTPELWIIYPKISQFRLEGNWNARNFECDVDNVQNCNLAKKKASMQNIFQLSMYFP